MEAHGLSEVVACAQGMGAFMLLEPDKNAARFRRAEPASVADVLGTGAELVSSSTVRTRSTHDGYTVHRNHLRDWGTTNGVPASCEMGVQFPSNRAVAGFFPTALSRIWV